MNNREPEYRHSRHPLCIMLGTSRLYYIVLCWRSLNSVEDMHTISCIDLSIEMVGRVTHLMQRADNGYISAAGG